MDLKTLKAIERYEALIATPTKPTLTELLELARKPGENNVKERLSSYADKHPEDSQYIKDLRELVSDVMG